MGGPGRIQNTLTLRAIRADDTTHDATAGRSAIDRIITGADPKPKRALDPHPKALPLHPTALHPTCTAQTHGPTSTPSLRLDQPPDTHVWRELIEDACSGLNVRRPLDSQPCGFAWLGQAIAKATSRTDANTAPRVDSALTPVTS
jgi:hypothetical protein